MRQKDHGLLKAVEHLPNNETAIGVEMLSQQGRITEIVDPQERIAAIARLCRHHENTLIVSPDNASRRAINRAVRQEVQALGIVDKTDHSVRVLTPRNDMTGADREWASCYEPGDVLHYSRGSKEHGIEPRSYVQVVAASLKVIVLACDNVDCFWQFLWWPEFVKNGLQPSGYHELRQGLKSRIRTAQVRGALAVNRELVLLYWSIGRNILAKPGNRGVGYPDYRPTPQ